MEKTCYNNGANLLGEDRSDGTKLRYFYDLNGICGFSYNGELYSYVKDILGNVIMIMDRIDDLPVARYYYDAYGNHKVLNPDGSINTSDSFIGNINPIRYRSYYYDVETGLYYLQSRYYDPTVGVFLSMDSAEYLAPEEIGGIDLYAYCCHNPIMYVDPTGQFVLTSFLIGLGIAAGVGAIVGALSYVASEAISYAITGNWTWSWGGFLGSVLGGAIGGALSFAFPGLGIVGSSAITGGISTCLGMLLENAFGEANHSASDIIMNSIFSAALSGAFAGITSLIKIPGFTGRGSISQVARQISTKFYNGTIGKITLKTFGKILLYEAGYSVFSTIASGIIDAYEYIKYIFEHAIPVVQPDEPPKFFAYSVL